jgi:hypothetical protein
MRAKRYELEGTWEEIAAHADELAGQRVRLIVLPSESEPAQENASKSSSVHRMLRYAGKWDGDDFEDRLREVYETRSRAKP